MIVEQLLKEWIAERAAAVDLTVAARSAKAIASEIEGYFHEVVARAEANALERTQMLAEKERSLAQALDVVAKLEVQLAASRDKMDRALAEKDRLIADKDRTIESNMETVGRIDTQFAAVREKLEQRLAAFDKEMAEVRRVVGTREETITRLEKELTEKARLVDTYREKFGVIMKAVG